MSTASTLQDSKDAQLDSDFQVNGWHLVLSSLVINLLALAMPIMMLQAYDRILPNYGSFSA